MLERVGDVVDPGFVRIVQDDGDDVESHVEALGRGVGGEVVGGDAAEAALLVGVDGGLGAARCETLSVLTSTNASDSAPISVRVDRSRAMRSASPLGQR